MTRVTRAQAQRRRAFAALSVITVIGLAVILWPKGSSEGVAGQPTATSAITPSTAPPTGSTPPDAIQAWLAWMPGGFPESFRTQIGSANGITKDVVVEGDTLWMTESRDANGAVVDRPPSPYTVPIDAFAVDPNGYAPFLPADVRDAVVGALRDGKAVLGESSAKLRRIGVGGSVSFGGQTVEVGAIAPDDAVGWSELLVNRDVGRQLGIEHERYLLAFADDTMTLQRFTDDVRALIPADDPLRTVQPGATRYVRVASGVNPPVVFKEVFGEFDAYPRSDDPVYLNMDPAWYDAHIQTRHVPVFSEPVTCNRALFPMLIGALRDVQAAGLASEIHTYSGCYAPRTVARSPIAPPSNHAYGAAIDINAPENPFGGTPTMDPRIVKIFEKWGFVWGGRFLIPDGMHFEYGSPPSAGV
jgi:D-alanyl-D-alanine carboxypeptidase-like protein